MKGHLRERSPGRWAIVLDAPGQGKRKRRWHSFEGTKRQAQIECARLISAIKAGTSLDPNRLTVAVFLQRWLDYVMPTVTPKTFERYSGIVNFNLVPLGDTLLNRLQPTTISGLYATMLRSGLAPRTVHHAHRVLSQALKQAVRWRLLIRNPCEDCAAPKVARVEMKVWDVATMAAALEEARKHRVQIPVLLAALCGLRRGEIAALRWRHVDLVRGQLAVVESAEQTKAGVRYKPPKAGGGRTVALPEVAKEELRAHKARQTEELAVLGVELDENTFVTAREDGRALQPNSIYHAWGRFLEAAALPRIRFHDLRHSHATALLAAGVHPKIVSERMGHSRVALTLDTYSHVIPGMQAPATAALDTAFGSLRNGSKMVAKARRTEDKKAKS